MLRAKAGTLRRRKEIRQVLEHINRNHEADIFDSTPLRNHATVRKFTTDLQDVEDFEDLAPRNPRRYERERGEDGRKERENV